MFTGVILDNATLAVIKKTKNCEMNMDSYPHKKEREVLSGREPEPKTTSEGPTFVT